MLSRTVRDTTAFYAGAGKYRPNYKRARSIYLLQY